MATVIHIVSGVIKCSGTINFKPGTLLHGQHGMTASWQHVNFLLNVQYCMSSIKGRLARSLGHSWPVLWSVRSVLALFSYAWIVFNMSHID